MARVQVQVPIEEDAAPVGSAVAPTPAEPTTQPIEQASSVQPEVSASNKIPLYKRVNAKLIGVTAAAVVLIILSIFILSLVQARNKLQKQVNSLTSNPQAQAQDEAQALKNQISQFMQLPSDETPTLATVTDATKVKTESFFVDAQNGDKVLLFNKKGLAILWRPSTKKIINVAPISPTTNQSSGTQQGTSTAPSSK